MAGAAVGVTDDRLLAAARAAREHAVAGQSGVKVGAALLTVAAQIVTGCNIESPSLIVHICAERNALFAALAAGHCHFVRVAVISDFHHPIPPCGFCRQALLEFAPDITVLMANLKGEQKSMAVRDLMPLAYQLADRSS